MAIIGFSSAKDGKGNWDKSPQKYPVSQGRVIFLIKGWENDKQRE